MLRIFLILFTGATLSGLVAYLGNKLGRLVGRRKMSLFRLRPRYTSNLITVGTGSLIFLVTLALAAAASDEVRTFLGGLDALQKQQQELVLRINDDTRKIMAGQILGPGQPLSVGVIECGRPEEQIREQIDLLLILANQNVLLRNNLAAKKIHADDINEGTHLVGYIIPEKTQIIRELSQARGSVLCSVINGSKPIFFGDRIVAKFFFEPNPRIFTKGQVIARALIDGKEPSDRVFGDVRDFVMRDLRYAAMQAGMMRNPVDDQLKTSIDLGMMKHAADRIAATNRQQELRVVANADIYPLGPLDARFEIRGQASELPSRGGPSPAARSAGRSQVGSRGRGARDP